MHITKGTCTTTTPQECLVDQACANNPRIAPTYAIPLILIVHKHILHPRSGHCKELIATILGYLCHYSFSLLFLPLCISIFVTSLLQPNTCNFNPLDPSFLCILKIWFHSSPVREHTDAYNFCNCINDEVSYDANQFNEHYKSLQ